MNVCARRLYTHFFSEKPSTPVTKLFIYLYSKGLCVYSCGANPSQPSTKDIEVRSAFQATLPALQIIPELFFIFKQIVFIISKTFFLSYKKVFVTNFVTHVRNFVTHITNFVIHVTNFVTNFFCADSEKYSGLRKK